MYAVYNAYDVLHYITILNNPLSAEHRQSCFPAKNHTW